MSQDPTNDKWSLVHVTALRRQETRLFPSQLWSRFCPHMTLHGRTEYSPTNIVNSHILTHDQLGWVLRKIYTIKAMRSVSIFWWRHQIETSSALLVLCVGNSPVIGEFPSQRPVTRGVYVFFDLCLNKRLGKQSRGWWFETPSCSL